MTNCSIDILMAVYNGEPYVAQQIESIQAQDCSCWRLLISDDGSSDGSLETVQRFVAVSEQQGADCGRIELLEKDAPAGGAAKNFLSLAQASTAPYVMFCDQDDVWLPEKVSKTLAKMQELEARHGASSPILVFSDMKVVDADLNVIHESFEAYSGIDPTRTSFQNLLAQSVGAGCTMMINRSLCDMLCDSPLRDEDKVIMHDWWMCLIAAGLGHIAYLDEPLSLYRQHGDNSIGAVAYNPAEKASSFDAMTASIVAILNQAQAFEKHFGAQLSEENHRHLSELLQSRGGSAAGRLCHLVKSGCWKSGLRKLGQLAVTVKLSDGPGDE